MEAMIENGEDWMQPMLDMRDWLTETQIPENKPKIRDHRRRNGRVEFFDAGGDKRIVWGPYKLEFRKEILRRLLRTQKLVRENGPDPSVWLIQPAELHKIRQLWLHDEGDWEDELPRIFEEETGETLDWFLDDHAGVGGMEKQLLQEIASEWDLPAELMRELLDVERSHAGMTRRSGIYDKIDSVFNKDWRSRDEVLAQVENQPGIDP
jgi:DNA sulfur modification protein DndC